MSAHEAIRRKAADDDDPAVEISLKVAQCGAEWPVAKHDPAVAPCKRFIEVRCLHHRQAGRAGDNHLPRRQELVTGLAAHLNAATFEHDSVLIILSPDAESSPLDLDLREMACDNKWP